MAVVITSRALYTIKCWVKPCLYLIYLDGQDLISTLHLMCLFKSISPTVSIWCVLGKPRSWPLGNWISGANCHYVWHVHANSSSVDESWSSSCILSSGSYEMTWSLAVTPHIQRTTDWPLHCRTYRSVEAGLSFPFHCYFWHRSNMYWPGQSCTSLIPAGRVGLQSVRDTIAFLVDSTVTEESFCAGTLDTHGRGFSKTRFFWAYQDLARISGTWFCPYWNGFLLLLC